MEHGVQPHVTQLLSALHGHHTDCCSRNLKHLPAQKRRPKKCVQIRLQSCITAEMLKTQKYLGLLSVYKKSKLLYFSC